jgi:hypothetical protein
MARKTWQMNSLYIVIGVMTLVLECGKSDTDAIFTKIAHLTLMLGCILAFSVNVQEIFMVGVILTLGIELRRGYRARNARLSDKLPKKRKLLS